jgi:hypothetical protein
MGRRSDGEAGRQATEGEGPESGGRNGETIRCGAEGAASLSSPGAGDRFMVKLTDAVLAHADG